MSELEIQTQTSTQVETQTPQVETQKIQVEQQDLERYKTLEEIAQWTALSLGLRLGERSLRSQAMRITAKHRAQLRKLGAILEDLYQKLENGLISSEEFKTKKAEVIKQIEEVREDLHTKAKPFYDRAREIRNREKVIAFEILPKLLNAVGYSIAPIEDTKAIPEWARKIVENELQKSQKSKSPSQSKSSKQ